MSTPSTRSLQRVGVHPCLLAALIAQAFVAAPAFANVDLAEGKRIFESVCATCHGARGQPDTSSPVVQALEAMPADLSDPLFNSREPAGDWEMVVRHGGHALGLSAAMPAQGDVLSDAQVESVVAYVKTLADTTGYPPGELNLMLPVRTKKAFPEDEFVLKTRWTVTEGKNPLRNVVEFEKRVGARGQTILEVVHEDSAEGSGVEEIEVGYKHALTWSAARQDLLSGAVVLALPSDADGSEE
ncbi:MAG TPA: cytochrome c, partial [Steroidobacteraceae bacterium]|nr:cytochrome c [Steroidobacteraceae bacterium]